MSLTEKFKQELATYETKGYKLTSLEIELSCGHKINMEPELLTSLDSDDIECSICEMK